VPDDADNASVTAESPVIIKKKSKNTNKKKVAACAEFVEPRSALAAQLNQCG